MREIKFRAWDKEIKKMRLPERMKHAISLNFNTGIVEIGNGGDVEFLQYTGLKDKNGKEIYEGDILDGGYVVEWETMEDNEMGFGVGIGFNVHPDIVEDSEVIGNIYENPKLIK